jgi:hypothetical protein
MVSFTVQSLYPQGNNPLFIRQDAFLAMQPAGLSEEKNLVYCWDLQMAVPPATKISTFRDVARSSLAGT